MLTEGRYIEGGAEAYAGRVLARNLGVSVGDQIRRARHSSNGGVAALDGNAGRYLCVRHRGTGPAIAGGPVAAVAEAFEMHGRRARNRREDRIGRARHGGRRSDAQRTSGKPGRARMAGAAARPGTGDHPRPCDRQRDVRHTGGGGHDRHSQRLSDDGVRADERVRHADGRRDARPRRDRSVAGRSLLLSGIGCAVGLAIGVPLVLLFGRVGISVGDAGAAMRAFHIADRLYPALSAAAIVRPVLLLLVCAQIAALLPTLRVRRLQPVEALRAA